MSLSKIIRNAAQAPAVFIGEKRYDQEQEARAERKLGTILPMVAVVTDPDGAKLIPIQEIDKVEKALLEEKEKSRREGLEEGHRRGREEGLDKAREVLQQFDKAISDAVSQRQSILEEAKHRVLDLVIQVSRKVTNDAIKIDPEATLTIIRGVIDSLIDRSRLKIKVNPDHLPIIEQNIDRFLEGSTTIKEIAIEPDPRVQYGGCFIETPTGDIDARLESQFEVISETMFSDESKS